MTVIWLLIILSLWQEGPLAERRSDFAVSHGNSGRIGAAPWLGGGRVSSWTKPRVEDWDPEQVGVLERGATCGGGGASSRSLVARGPDNIYPVD